MKSDASNVLRIRGLRKAFRGHLGIGRREAIRGIDLDVRRGEIYGLLGPNGAGKTTTIKLVLGLLRPDAGSIELLGRPATDPRSHAGLGYLPEHPYFYTYLTAREFLDFYARLQGVPASDRRDCVERSLQRVGLADRADSPLRKFSKGMTQRLGLAQAIQHDPDLVILDEPMSGLDPIGRREVRDLIVELKEAGKTVFFSSHILQDAEMICDRVVILESGRVRSVGPLRELVSDRIHWFEVTLRHASGEEEMLRVENLDALRETLDRVHDQGGQVVAVWPRRETLEDLFVEEVAKAKEAAS